MGRRARVRAGFLPVGATGNCGRRGAPPDEGEAMPRPYVALGRSRRRARSCSEQTNREAGLGNCGRRGASPDEGEAVPRPYVALGRSCRRAGSCSEQTNREAGLGNCGRRGAPPDEGEAVPRPYVALGRSRRRAGSCSEQTNREAGLGNCGRRGASPDEGEACLAPTLCPMAGRAWEIVGGAGRRRMRARQCLAPTSPSVVHADALVRAPNKQIAGRAWEIVDGAGHRRMRARQCLAPTLCPMAGRAWEIVGGAGRRRMRARQCLAPTTFVRLRIRRWRKRSCRLSGRWTSEWMTLEESQVEALVPSGLRQVRHSPRWFRVRTHRGARRP